MPYRDEARVGNIKFVWELSRHQPATLLACAWWITGDPAYAERAALHLTSWWQQNPFLTGVHWTSGIEVGLRLLSWTWIRALLADWPEMRPLFDDNPVFLRQLYHHQLYLDRFHSRGSSANNHLIAEFAGLSAASTAFPWFAESARWARWSRAGLARQAQLQTHADGWNREQASDYHRFVFEMLLAAMLAARLSGRPMDPSLDEVLRRKADAWAASVDATGRPPRFGDGDEGRGILLDTPHADPSRAMLDAARALYGAAPWWPDASGSVLGHVAGLLAGSTPRAVRTLPRRDHFDDAGITILRDGAGAEEIWVRCDAGPHGFLSIAAHAHADALGIELRCGGVDVLADPGTYCYHGEPRWRAGFKGTRGHNTLCVDELDQAVHGGPFLWLSRPSSRLAGRDTEAPAPWWQASHDGYRRLADPVLHHRRVELDRATRTLAIQDWIEAAASHAVLLAYHLGPDIAVRLDGDTARLSWPGGAASLALPSGLSWSVHRGEAETALGWYSNGLGHKTHANMLAGRGSLPPGSRLLTRLTLSPQQHQEHAPNHVRATPPCLDRRRKPAGAVRP